MQAGDIHKYYFANGTRGYNILSRFYYKYHDLFERTNFPQFKEFLNQIYLNIAGIDFSREIRNKEAYIIASIKIQCRVQLDNAVKLKNKMQVNSLTESDESDESQAPLERLRSGNPGPLEQLEMKEAFHAVNLFKLTLNPDELELFNKLTDDVSRKEISEIFNINLNTLDTRIRRLRIKFLSYLKRNGYNMRIFAKYDK